MIDYREVQQFFRFEENNFAANVSTNYNRQVSVARLAVHLVAPDW